MSYMYVLGDALIFYHDIFANEPDFLKYSISNEDAWDETQLQN